MGKQMVSHPYTPIGQMAIRNSTTNSVSITQATTSDMLLPISIGTTYKKVTGFSSEIDRGVSTVNDGLTVNTSGFYRFGGWASIRHSQNTSTSGVLFAVRRNGVIIGTTPSPVPALLPNIGDIGLISGEGFTELLAGDSIEVYVASNKTGTVSIVNCTITGHFLTPY